MTDGLSQITIEKLNKNNFQMWKFRIMNFLMGKGYWEFVIGDETKPPLLENPHNDKFNLIKLDMKKQEKSCIGLL
jgi:hypothetical protein